jgi:hypothetical protein
VAWIDFEGDEAFIARLTEALALLRERAPDDHEFVAGQIRIIRQNPRSGAHVEHGRCIVDLSMKVVGVSASWCASALAHEAYHNKQYRDYADEHGLPVPPEVYTRTEAEVACNEYQLGVLERMGAPVSELQHLRSQTGLHWDVNGDGVYDEEDYRQRGY